MLADGQIESVEELGDRLLVGIRDWHERRYEIEFVEVLEWSSDEPFGEDLCHAAVRPTSPDTGWPRHPNEPCEVSFISAWDDRPMLRVVARGFGFR